QLVLTAHELYDLEPSDVRHVEVEHDEVERLQRQSLDRLEAARGLRHGERRLRTQTRGDHVAHHLAVVDDEDRRHTCTILAFSDSVNDVEFCLPEPMSRTIRFGLRLECL